MEHSSYYLGLLDGLKVSIESKDQEIINLVASLSDNPEIINTSSVVSVFTDEESGLELTVSGVVIDFENLLTISQKDERFIGLKMSNGHYINGGGCGPSSMINALFAALNFTDGDRGATAIELFSLFKGKKVDTSNMALASLANGVDKDKYPNVARLIDGVNIVNISGDTKGFMRNVQNTTEPGLYLGKSGLSDNYNSIFSALFRMDENGLGTSNIIVSRVTTGTGGTDGVFKTDGGHYTAFVFNASEFTETGTFYLLDSLPRALEGETYGHGYGDGYNPNIQYQFVSDPNKHKGFIKDFDVEHIQPTIVKVSLSPEKLSEYKALTTDSDRVNFLQTTFEKDKIKTYGEGSIIFDIE